MYRTTPYHTIGHDQDDFCLGKTYDQARAHLTLKPEQSNPHSKGNEESEWSEHLHSHNYQS